VASDDKKTQLGTADRQPPVAAVGTPVPADKPRAPKTSYLPDVKDPLLGATIAGRYRIERKLGEGGMGAVYLAKHTILEKLVALKVLHGEFVRKPDLVERFMQEAKAASRIRHENVIDISDFGHTPEGHVFFAMELLEGHDLHDEIARSRVSGDPIPWARTKHIFLQICGALAAAHARGIVHRDLKPENVYLVEFLGDPDFVKLLDFGIAKMTEVSNEEGGRKLTKTGMLFGTPEYMSPEQARGEKVDHRVDIYAMGCILFQLVSGHVPFVADNFMGVLSMHLTEPAPRIAPEAFDRIGAPRALSDVIARALVKDRGARYQTIDALAAAVREASGDVPAPAARTRPPTGPVGGVAAIPRESTGPRKAEWTGKLRVPEVPIDDTRPREHESSKAPYALAALFVLAGGGAAAYFALRGQGSAPEVATGSAGAAIATPGSAAPPPPPPPPAAPKLPDQAELVLDSVPHGAAVTDLSINKPIGKTPLHYSVSGSKTARQFAFHLHGYGDTTVELVPDRATIEFVEKLERGAAAAKVVHVVPDATIKPAVASGSGAVTKPDTGQSGAVTKPDTGQPDKPDKAPDKPDKKPDKPDKPDKPCNDDDMPCLKGFGSGQ
jgi:serine/threonine-protein kinase